MVCGVFFGIFRVFCNEEPSENGCGRFNLQSVQAELNLQGSSKKLPPNGCVEGVLWRSCLWPREYLFTEKNHAHWFTIENRWNSASLVLSSLHY